MTGILQAKNIERHFRLPDGRPMTVIGGIDLDLQAGEIVCLLGASGSGKTTLLRILAGMETADTGDVQSDIRRPGPRLGYLAQSDSLLPWRTVAANVALGLELAGQGKKPARRAALEDLKHVGLERFADSYPAQLSGGMRQRALLARMLVLNPSLLLLDEPMSNLDALARRELATLVKTYTRDRQAATLVVTHSIEEACFLADRILLVTRAPARLFKEIRLSDDGGPGLARGDALNPVMHDLWSALGAAA